MLIKNSNGSIEPWRPPVFTPFQENVFPLRVTHSFLLFKKPVKSFNPLMHYVSKCSDAQMVPKFSFEFEKNFFMPHFIKGFWLTLERRSSLQEQHQTIHAFHVWWRY